MLATRVLQHQAELRQHHRWLTGFLQRTTTGHPARHAHPLQHPRYYASPPDRVFRKPSSRHGRVLRESGGIRYTNALPEKEVFKRLNNPKAKAKPNTISYDTSQNTNPVIANLQRNIKASYLAHAIEDYSALNTNDKASLSKPDIRPLARLLHYRLRVAKRHADNEPVVNVLLHFADTLVKDVKDGILAPSGKAHVHLIGIYKEAGLRDKGIQFWNWLQEQEEPWVDVDVYGAAVELLAVNGAPLAELESLYQEALSRFPGNFAAYHLSPEAVVPDREQPFTIGGIPISLLQGIMTARLLNGDTRNAYLALDAALRLIPDQVPSRFFSLFLAERPLEEAFMAHAIACRAGYDLNGSYFRPMLSALRHSSDLSSPIRHSQALRSMISASHLYIGAGGAVSSNSVNEMIITTSQFLRVRGVDAMGSQERQQIVDAAMEVIRSIMQIFARYQANPTIPAFNSIITNLGGFGHSKQTIGISLKNADALGLAPTDVTWRSILSAAGMFRDKALVEKSWTNLVQQRIEAGQNPSAPDLHALVKPAHLSGAIGFANEQLEKFRDMLDAEDYEKLQARLDDIGEAEAHSIEDVEPADLSVILAEIERVKADLAVIDERTSGSPVVQDFSKQALPLTMQPLKSKIDLPEAALREIYDEMSTVPASTRPADSYERPASEAKAESSTSKSGVVNTKSKTNLSLATLRFENWKMLNQMLELAEANDEAYIKRVDEAIARGHIPPKRTVALSAGVAQSWGISDVQEPTATDGEEVSVERIEQVKKEILRLRGRPTT